MTPERPKVLVADAIKAEGLEPLRKAGIEVLNRAGITPEELLTELADVDGLLIRSRTKVTPELLAAAPQLRVIGRAGTGIDNVDLPAATRAGVVVMNVPGGNAAAAAEHTIALMTCLARHVAPAAAALRAGEWDRKRYTGIELSGRVLGVIGFGRIGRAVARRARGLMMDVVVADPLLTPEAARDAGFDLVPLDELVAQVDFLSVHVPLTPRTKGLVGARLLSLAKPGLRVLNVARGGIVDEAALLRALQEGRIAGAALDVFEEEPPTIRELIEHEGVLATPHLGASTEEAQFGVALAVARQVARFLSEGVVQNAVNLAGIPPEDADRLRPWQTLATALGRIAAASIGPNRSPKAIELAWFGDELSEHVAALLPDALVGLLAAFSDFELNSVNARHFADQNGIIVSTAQGAALRGWPSGLALRIDGNDGSRVELAGVVSRRGEARLIEIDGNGIDLPLHGTLLIVRNADRPGVIAHLSLKLAEAGVNIASMSVAREQGGGEAITMIGLDACPSPELLDALASTDQIHALQVAELGN